MRLRYVYSVFLIFYSLPLLSSTVPVIPLELLFGNPEKTNPLLSPDGKCLAYCAPVNGVINIWLKNSDDIKDNGKPITQDTQRGIRYFYWSYDSKKILYYQDTDGDENWHVYALDVESGNTHDLTPFSGVRSGILSLNKRYPNEILITMNRENKKFSDVYRLSLVDNTITLDTKNSGDVIAWLADNNLQVRAAVQKNDDGGQTLLVRNTATHPWRTLLDILTPIR